MRYTSDQMPELVRAHVKDKYGRQVDACAVLGIDQSAISYAVNGGGIPPSLLRDMGLKKVVTYETSDEEIGDTTDVRKLWINHRHTLEHYRLTPEQVNMVSKIDQHNRPVSPFLVGILCNMNTSGATQRLRYLHELGYLVHDASVNTYMVTK